MSTGQFARCHVYQGSKIGDVLGEADRHPDFISHVQHPERPTWLIGSPIRVKEAISLYMSTPANVKARDGTLGQRKRRVDHRCLVAGIVTWPDLVDTFRARDYPLDRMETFKKWQRETLTWLRKQFSEKLIAACTHFDESHPHIHFFVVGDAQRLHPGMKNELLNGNRLTDNAERIEKHKAGLRAWLDDFHVHVGGPCGLQRSLGSRPTWRIKDRGTRSKLLEIDKALAERSDSEIQAQRDELWDSEVKTHRPRMIF
jgi:hypothetical protein